MEKIVIIEDDPGIRTVLRLALKGADFADVVAEERGDSGLRAVLRERPALVVLDLMLPGMDGLAVCREIRRTPSVASTPIIVLTAKSAEDDIVRGLELGADDYVTKPFSNAVLIARIRADRNAESVTKRCRTPGPSSVLNARAGVRHAVAGESPSAVSFPSAST